MEMQNIPCTYQFYCGPSPFLTLAPWLPKAETTRDIRCSMKQQQDALYVGSCFSLIYVVVSALVYYSKYTEHEVKFH